MHEDLVSVKESKRCWLNNDGLYVIQFDEENFTPNAERVPNGFSYTSNSSPQMLTVTQL